MSHIHSNHKQNELETGNFNIKTSCAEKLLSTSFDFKLKFSPY